MFSFFLPVPFSFPNADGEIPANSNALAAFERRGGERKEEILLGVRAGWFLFWRREKERERERERRIEGTCISESGRRSWSLYRTEERESISSSSSASVSSSADDER